MMMPMKICSKICLSLCLLWVTPFVAADCSISTDLPVAESIEVYESCIAKGHQMVSDIRTALGEASFATKDYKAAIEHFSEIIEQTDRPGKAHFNRALAYLEIGSERKALADLEAANGILPRYSPAHFYRGVTLKKMRRYGQAIDAYETALNLSAGGDALAPIYFELANAQLSNRNPTAAIESLDKAIDSDPRYAPAYFTRALTHQDNGAPALAVADYNQYLEYEPESAEAYYNRGLIFQDLRQDHLAIKDFNQAIALNPRYVRARTSKGIAYLWPVLPVLLVLFLG